jgi:peptidoglycan/LPS O-acetylase OafA/YrhL
MPSARTHFLDNLRVALVMLVVFHHTAITYGGEGGWYWREISGASGLSGLTLTLFCAVNQAFFMGFLFLLSGYFTPPSFAHKGARRFILDRALRLGVPLLFFGFILGPVTIALAEIDNGHPFIGTFMVLWNRRMFNLGPLWFVEILLIFTAGYVVWRFMNRRSSSSSLALPGHRAILISALIIGAAAFLLRLAVPVGKTVLGGLQIGYFASYIFLFITGCMASKGRWLERMKSVIVRPWLIVSISALPVLPIAIILSKNIDRFLGGWNIMAVVYAFWEPFVAWGIIMYLLFQFQRSLNRGSWLSHWLAERSYAVFIIHPPILVGISLALHPWGAPPMFKFVMVGSLSCMTCLAAASLLLLVPGARRVL